LGEVHSEWEIYRARLRSLECREPVLKFSPEVNKQIGIDVTEFKGGRYKQFDDLLDGIFCAYLAYYFWYWGEDGCWVVGDLETDLSPCRDAAYRIARFTRMRCSPPLPRSESPSARSIAGRPCHP